MLLRVIKAVFIGTITIMENEQQIVERCLLESIERFHRKDYVFGLFHSPYVCFYQKISKMRIIQFCHLCSNNSSKYCWKRECAWLENVGSRLLVTYPQWYTSQCCSVTSENWRGGLTRLPEPLYSLDLAPITSSYSSTWRDN
jgi:hypothetical protein